MTQFIEVILPLNLKGTFTYKVPENFIDEIEIGKRVLVPFGGKKIYTGIIYSTHSEKIDDFEIKPFINLLDNIAIIPKIQLDFWKWLSDYYLINIGEIYRLALPSSLKLESQTHIRLKASAQIDTSLLEANEIFIIEALHTKSSINLKEIEAFIPKKEIVKTINSLIDLQYIEIDEKVNEKYKPKEIYYLKLNNDIVENITEILQQLKKSPKQKELFLHILNLQTQNPSQELKKYEVMQNTSFNNTHLNGLIDKKIIIQYLKKQDRLNFYSGDLENFSPLNLTQKNALNQINQAFDLEKNILLHGVTGSGKTHIFLEKINDFIKIGKKIIVLVPEISTAKQITQRLEKKYGKKLGFYHQKLNDFEKVEIWQKIKKNKIDIIIGTRHSLFLPLDNLGLIVVDEEHDSAYTPDNQPFFNTKNAALRLASLHNSRVILSSATPSLETYQMALNQKIEYVFINERFGNIPLPEIKIIDFKEAKEQKNLIGHFCQESIQKIIQNTENQRQTIILHNKRGYSNVVECQKCGFVNFCPNCDVVMTFHKTTNEMKCHYCNSKSAKAKFCPKCKSTEINEKGIGVEQIYEQCLKIFPNAEIERMDKDSMSKKFAYEKLFEKIQNKETDIVIGTQMISKGLDFDDIDLVVIPRADHLLHIEDFRAEERAFQLITQISGRAGRKSGKGEVLLQTYQPDYFLFKLIKNNDFPKIYAHLLEERKKFLYPPFVKMILIELRHQKNEKVMNASSFLQQLLAKHIPKEVIFGPVKPSVGKINNLYRYQILIKLPKGKKFPILKEFVRDSLENFKKIGNYQSIKIQLYVDV